MCLSQWNYDSIFNKKKPSYNWYLQETELQKHVLTCVFCKHNMKNSQRISVTSWGNFSKVKAKEVYGV